MISVEDLARRLYVELDKDGWGDVDPYLFKCVAEGEVGDPDVDALREVLVRALGDS